MMMHEDAGVRLQPTFWRHDYYTLIRLKNCITRTIDQLRRDRVLVRDRSVVVDLGSGRAPYKPLFGGRIREYVACDIEAGPAIDVVMDESSYTGLSPRIADCVVSFQVLEHVWDTKAYLSECRRLLATGGRLLLSTHGTWLYHPHPTDFRRWTRDGLIREVESHGMRVLSIEALIGPLAWTTQFRTLAYHHVLAKLGPAGVLLSSALCMLMSLRMWIEDALTPQTLIDKNAAVFVIVAEAS